MIQDIAPHHYDNAYHPTQPKAGDRVFFYHEGSTLLSAATGEPFTWEEVTDLTGGETLETTYFFRIDETAFHWSREVPQSVLEAALPVKDSHFRSMQPGWLAFAGITASQLHQWYGNHRFCGRCGQNMEHDKVERAMRCPACGNLVYPTISPAVIVAVTHGDRLLLTKYSRPGAYRNYALIAGFAEIGEPLEDTVRREVMEEVGLPVKNIRFYKSQPWSFSSSLLAGFYCDLDTDDETVTLQADELGVSIGQLLRIQGDQLRNKRFVRAEKLANEAPVKILFPVVVFIFPSVFIILIGPIVYQALRTLAR